MISSLKILIKTSSLRYLWNPVTKHLKLHNELINFLQVKETPVFKESTYQMTINIETFHQRFYKEISALKIGSYPVTE